MNTSSSEVILKASQELMKIQEEWISFSFSEILVEMESDYFNIHGNPSEVSKFSPTFKNSDGQTEQSGKACRVSNILCFLPLNADGHKKLVFVNPLDKSQALRLSSTNSSHYLLSQKAGKISSGDNIVVDVKVLFSKSKFTEAATLEHDLFYVKIMETTGVKSTIQSIKLSFQAAFPDIIGTHYVRKLWLGVPKNPRNLPETSIQTFDETKQPAASHLDQEYMIDNTRLFKYVVQLKNILHLSLCIGVTVCSLFIGVCHQWGLMNIQNSDTKYLESADNPII